MTGRFSTDNVMELVRPASRPPSSYGAEGGAGALRALPAGRRRGVGPFVRFDRFRLDALDVDAHPHIGLAELTYLFAGELVQRDSTGRVQTVRPGEAHLALAGGGLVHAERATGALSGVQSWIALPRAEEERQACSQHMSRAALPETEGEGFRLRLIAGALHGRHATLLCGEALFQAELALEDGARFRLGAEHEERAAYVIEGAVEFCGREQPIGADRMAVLRPGAEVALRARGPARLVLFGGAKLPEKRHLSWNFVSTRRARIEQAAADWRDGRFPPVPGENAFTPLPAPWPPTR